MLVTQITCSAFTGRPSCKWKVLVGELSGDFSAAVMMLNLDLDKERDTIKF